MSGLVEGGGGLGPVVPVFVVGEDVAGCEVVTVDFSGDDDEGVVVDLLPLAKELKELFAGDVFEGVDVIVDF